MELALPSIYTIALIALWTLPWKGVALWMAARRDHLGWFIVLLIVNSLAILEIIYIFYIARRYAVETTEQASTNDT